MVLKRKKFLQMYEQSSDNHDDGELKEGKN